MSMTSIRFLVLALCALVLALSGCASKVPKTLPISPADEQEATLLWSGFIDAKRPSALDADARLGWDLLLGAKGGVGVSLQVEQPARFRFAANDPLGRSFIVAVADANSFTLVDSRIGHVYQGRTGSKFWQSYVPEVIRPGDLLSFLGGFLPEGEGHSAKGAQDKESTGFWYQWVGKRSLHQYVLLDRRSGEMQRHLLLDAQGSVVLEVHYAGYKKDIESGFTWPRHLQISGQAVTGTLRLQVERIYSHAPQKEAAFRLIPPPHFKVELVP